MEKYLLLKLGMNILEVEKVLGQKIILERNEHRPDSKEFFCLNDTIGTYLNFTNDKILSLISFFYPFSVAVDGITIRLNMNEVEKINGLPEKKKIGKIIQNKRNGFIVQKTLLTCLLIKKYMIFRFMILMVMIAVLITNFSPKLGQNDSF